MRKQLFFILPAGLAGALMAIQGGLNGLLGKTIGLTETTFAVHLTGLVTILPFFLTKLNSLSLAKLSKVPWYAWLGGSLGVLIIYGVALSFPRLGAGKATTAIVAAQLFTAFLLDRFGWLDLSPRPFRTMHLVGIALIAVGAYLLSQQK
ncbi:MAG TPA: DMT family transporter [Firmicutes bacterium]|nr:DMT family transporter [Bacillota bacterium]HOQ23525.1 DMT family transporter [Bacillota bacterium]HPT68214.1 DMT family transporter [Bacillota bacterium]